MGSAHDEARGCVIREVEHSLRSSQIQVNASHLPHLARPPPAERLAALLSCSRTSAGRASIVAASRSGVSPQITEDAVHARLSRAKIRLYKLAHWWVPPSKRYVVK